MAHRSLLKLVLLSLLPVAVIFTSLEMGARVYEHVDQTLEGAELARRDHEILVYVYGESTVAGLPIPEVGFVRQMAYHAARRYPGTKVRFVNLGRPGIDSARLRAIFEATIGNRPDFAILLCGHNEYLSLELPPFRQPFALVRVASRAVGRLSRVLRPPELMPERLYPADRASPTFRRKASIYVENMTAMVHAARAKGVPVMLGTLPSNLRDWPPVFRRLVRSVPDASYEPAMTEGLAAAERGDAAALRSVVMAREPRDAEDPMFRFLRGRLRLLDGDAARALEDLRYARDSDPFPWRASSTFNEHIRTLARDERTLFADLEEAVRAGGIPGFDLVTDNCHPTPEAGFRMAMALLKEAEHARILPAPAADDRSLSTFLADAGFASGTPLRLRYLLTNGTYVMKTPFFHFPIARRIFEQAAVESPKSWEVHANLATILLFEGRKDEGVEHLRLATELHGRPLDVANRAATPYLKEAVEAAGVRLAP